MGMFDDLLVEVDLPDGYTGKAFQTKDLDCTLSTYKITSDGKLVREVIDYETVPDDERPPEPPADAHWLDKIRWLHTDKRETGRHWDVIEHHGYIFFYNYEKIDGEMVWHEYRAKFTDGQLVNIEKIEERD